MDEMSPAEILRIIHNADQTGKNLARIWAAMELIAVDARFVCWSHTTGLPAMREYRQFVRGHHGPLSASARYRSLRGKLGSVRRQQYCYQKKTFMKLLQVCTGDVKAVSSKTPTNPGAAELVWLAFKRAERRALAQHASGSASH